MLESVIDLRNRDQCMGPDIFQCRSSGKAYVVAILRANPRSQEENITESFPDPLEEGDGAEGSSSPKPRGIDWARFWRMTVVGIRLHSRFWR